MSLRGLFWWSVASLGMLVLLGAGSLIALTTFLHVTTGDLERASTRSRAAQQVEIALYRFHFAALRGHGGSSGSEPQAQLRRALSDLEGTVRSERGQRLIDELQSRLAAYQEAIARLPDGSADLETTRRQLDPLLLASLEPTHRLQALGDEQAALAAANAGRLDETANVIGVCVAALFAVIFVVFLLQYRRLVYRPVRGLDESIGRFGRGDRTARARPEGARELASIAVTFNATADLVERQLTSMATVAHDLRNPLSALGTALGTIRPDRALPSEEQLRRIGALASRQISKIDRMVGDLLDVARLETGRIELHPQPCDLRQLAHETLELFRDASPKHELILAEPQTPVMVSCDVGRLEQALNNLVSNAIKYSPEGGPVRLEVGSSATQAWLSVSDRGRGILPDQRERIFEPFRRSAAPDEKIPGVGLGLSITRRIVESHGGRVEVESEVGKGSTFRIVLPHA